jgi:pilus assembly protein TadC
MLAIFATLFLTYVLGVSLLELLDVHVYMEGELIEPLKAIGVSAMATVILVLIALAIVLSVFGSLLFFGLLIAGALVMVAIGVFWPVFLVAVIIWMVTRNERVAKNKPQYT